MLHSAAALAEALGLAVAAKQELTDLGGRLALRLNDEAAVPLRVPSAPMPTIPGLENIWWVQLPCAYPEAPTCTRLMVGGLSGAICQQAQVPHGVTLQLLEGALLWWQGSFGHDDDGRRNYRRYEKRDEWTIAENEPHGFVVLADFLAYNIFDPFFPE